jgi:Tfp pilus assembly protein PilF
MADRYAYFSLIGVYVALVWGIANLAARSAVAGKVAAGVGVILLAVLAARTQVEQRYWRNSETLWAHALQVTKDNAAAHTSYGEVLMKQGKLDEAAGHFTEALRISPDFCVAQNNLGILLAMKGDIKGATEKFEEALRVKPDYAKAMCNLAKCRLEENNNAEAKRLFVEALPYMQEYDPNRDVVENAIRQLSAMEGAR